MPTAKERGLIVVSIAYNHAILRYVPPEGKIIAASESPSLD